MILSLPFSLPDATPIGDRYAMQTHAGSIYYFFNLKPFDYHPADDRRAMLLRATTLHVDCVVRQADIMRAFAISRPTSRAPSNAIARTAAASADARQAAAASDLPSRSPAPTAACWAHWRSCCVTACLAQPGACCACQPGSTTPDPAWHRLHHLAQELHGRGLAAGAVPRH